MRLESKSGKSQFSSVCALRYLAWQGNVCPKRLGLKLKMDEKSSCKVQFSDEYMSYRVFRLTLRKTSDNVKQSMCDIGHKALGPISQERCESVVLGQIVGGTR
eukprot:COSAG02_NODE_2712_length_8183_cov_20.357867_2_plen_103_part_00